MARRSAVKFTNTIYVFGFPVSAEVDSRPRGCEAKNDRLEVFLDEFPSILKKYKTFRAISSQYLFVAYFAFLECSVSGSNYA